MRDDKRFNKEATMKRLLTTALLVLAASAAQAADEIKLQLKWVTQAQFAGYYVAAAKGIIPRRGWT